MARAGTSRTTTAACLPIERARFGTRAAGSEYRNRRAHRTAKSQSCHMSASPRWQRRLARRLVGHAEMVLLPIRPSWAGVLKSELEHVPADPQALRWAVGCLWASYMERYFGRLRSLLAAIAIGVVFALLSERIAGIMAARPWPHWYVAFGRMHKHFSLELWFTVTVILPLTFDRNRMRCSAWGGRSQVLDSACLFRPRRMAAIYSGGRNSIGSSNMPLLIS
jgi:hypothetical protein